MEAASITCCEFRVLRGERNRIEADEDRSGSGRAFAKESVVLEVSRKGFRCTIYGTLAIGHRIHELVVAALTADPVASRFQMTLVFGS